MAHAASFSGTVTNKTTNKPAAGDTVSLVDIQAGMAEAASATTDASGKYSFESRGSGPYLIRVSHQGGTYFIAAPGNGGQGDIVVYDVGEKVDGVGIDADMFLIEAAGGMLRIHERFLVRNTSLPPRAQFSTNTFEVVLPADAELDGASATRPGGLGTNTRLVPLGERSHYTFSVPIQPNQGEKETLFEIQYHLPYSGKYTFSPRPQLPAANLVAYVAKGITFADARGASFQSVQEDPRVQTFIAKNVHPGQAISFALSGEGRMPTEAQGQGNGTGQQAGMGESGSGEPSIAGGRPGGGIGNPIGSPDPLTAYKWWIMSALALLLIAAAALLLRKQSNLRKHHDNSIEGSERLDPKPVAANTQPLSNPGTVSTAPIGSRTILLDVIKEELFAIESEKLSGTLPASEYTEIRTGLEAVLRRALKSA
jgi:hypothetical protein